jgi:hypothetical protein
MLPTSTHVPLSDLIKITSDMDKGKKFLNVEETHEDPLIVLQEMNHDRKNGGYAPSFITLVVNNLLLHNCMLEYGNYTNVIYLKVMDQFILKTKIPYRNVCGINSREIKVCGFIKDLKFSLVAYPDISFFMDVVIIDVSDSCGMVLSIKWAVIFGTSIQMVLSYTTIQTNEGTFFTLYRHPSMRYQVEDPRTL